MATPEERLATLEQFRTETMRAYTNMAYEVTILKGLGEDSIKRLAALQREMTELKQDLVARFDLVDDRLNQMYDELNAHSLLLHEILDRLPPKE